MDYSTGLCARSIMNLLLWSTTITFFSHRLQATNIYVSTALSEQHKVRKSKRKNNTEKNIRDNVRPEDRKRMLLRNVGIAAHANKINTLEEAQHQHVMSIYVSTSNENV